MELFTIERYEGDLYSAENNTEKESKNLAQLLERARGRKRSRECSNYKQKDESTVESAPVLEALPKMKKNTKKKEKRSKLEGKVIKETKKGNYKSVGNGNDDVDDADDAAKTLKGG
jgi:hypothetical protein